MTNYRLYVALSIGNDPLVTDNSINKTFDDEIMKIRQKSQILCGRRLRVPRAGGIGVEFW